MYNKVPSNGGVYKPPRPRPPVGPPCQGPPLPPPDGPPPPLPCEPLPLPLAARTRCKRNFIRHYLTCKNLLSHTLGSYHRRLPSAGRSWFRPLFLEHWGILQHVGQYHEAYFRSTNVDVLKIGSSAISICDGDLRHLAIHIILCLNELAPVHFAGDGFACYNVAFSLVQHFNGHPDRHNRDEKRLQRAEDNCEQTTGGFIWNEEQRTRTTNKLKTFS